MKIQHIVAATFSLAGLTCVHAQTLNLVQDVTIYGNLRFDKLGQIMAPIGDFNKDGFDDFAVAAPGDLNNGTTRPGEVFVIFGAPTLPSTIFRSDLNGSRGFLVVGADNGDFTGSALAGADLNNDGFDDLIIGSVFADIPQQSVFNTGVNAGEIAVIYGKATMPAQFNLSTLAPSNNPNGNNGFLIQGETTNLNVGFSVEVADVNNDGKKDLIFGCGNGAKPANEPPLGRLAGNVYILFGRNTTPKFPAVISTTQFPGIGGSLIYGADTSDGFGGLGLDGLARIGDYNGDNIEDFAVLSVGGDGIGNSAPNFTNYGEVTIIYGKSSFPQTIDVRSIVSGSSTLGTIIYGTALDSITSGCVVRRGGDFDGDGFDDLVIGDPNGSSAANAIYESVSIIYGGAGQPAAQTMDDLLLLNKMLIFEKTNNQREDLGVSCYLGGDYNNDGFDDLLMGALAFSGTTGRAYIGLGNRQRKVGIRDISTADFTIPAFNPNSFGESLCSAGDVNNDGVTDFLIAAPNGTNITNTQGTSGTGQAFLLYGTAAPPPPPPVPDYWYIY